MEQLVGESIGDRYRVKAVLDRQANYFTLIAHDLEGDRQVVIKLLLAGPETSAEQLQLLEQEATTLQQLHHPTLPLYLDFLEANTPLGPAHALVQSFIPAQSLSYEADSYDAETVSVKPSATDADSLSAPLFSSRSASPDSLGSDPLGTNSLAAGSLGSGFLGTVSFGADTVTENDFSENDVTTQQLDLPFSASENAGGSAPAQCDPFAAQSLDWMTQPLGGDFPSTPFQPASFRDFYLYSKSQTLEIQCLRSRCQEPWAYLGEPAAADHIIYSASFFDGQMLMTFWAYFLCALTLSVFFIFSTLPVKDWIVIAFLLWLPLWGKLLFSYLSYARHPVAKQRLSLQLKLNAERAIALSVTALSSNTILMAHWPLKKVDIITRPHPLESRLILRVAEQPYGDDGCVFIRGQVEEIQWLYRQLLAWRSGAMAEYQQMEIDFAAQM